MKQRKKIVIAVGVASLSCLVAACIFFRIREVHHLQAYYEMAGEFEPVWREFAFRRLDAGDSVGELLQKHQPRRTEQFGRYAVLHFYNRGSIGMSGVNVITRDGKLLSAYAGSCTWQLTFFETADPDLDREYEAYATDKAKQLKSRDLDRFAAKAAVFHQRFERWPTNVKEFAQFVTDIKLAGTNPLNITLEEQANGSIVIGSIQFTEEKRHVPYPAQADRE